MQPPKSLPRLTIIPNTLVTFGGGERLAFELTKLLENRFEVKIVNPRSKNDLVRASKVKLLREFKIKRSQVVDVNCRSTRAKVFGTEEFLLMLPSFQGLRILEKTVRDSDVVYCITHNPLLFLNASRFANKYRKKFVFAIQNYVFSKIYEKHDVDIATKLGIPFYKALFAGVKYFHTLNSYDTKLIRDNIPSAKVYQTPYFIGIKDSKPSIGESRFEVLFVGRLPKYQKGVDLFCKSADKAIRAEKGIVFRVIGSGGDGEPQISALAKKYPNNVVWEGFKPYAEVKKAYAAASLLVFTARGEELRYLPLVFIEAQSYGLPTVAFNGKGYEGILTDGVEGSLIYPYDTDRFADAIVKYYGVWKKDRNVYLKLKKKIAHITTEKFGEDALMPKMVQMLSPEETL
ncbi:MAG: glycosyltransferase family 4 protein [Candidatus Micrarchaeota archaeon]|nr:glycosyltransferase family 4 protein [Candidatus Micrarchaeota archaeon]